MRGYLIDNPEFDGYAHRFNYTVKYSNADIYFLLKSCADTW